MGKRAKKWPSAICLAQVRHLIRVCAVETIGYVFQNGSYGTTNFMLSIITLILLMWLNLNHLSNFSCQIISIKKIKFGVAPISIYN
jgi:uncharacterized membrane protein YccF (DUF307 family)